MTPTDTYKEIRDAAAKDAGKAILFFFVGVPLAFVAIAYLLI